MSDYPWRWRIKQGGMAVASGAAPDRQSMMREMSRCAMVYGQDGPIEAMETRTGKNKWRAHLENSNAE